MIDTKLGVFVKDEVNFYPQNLQKKIEETIDAIYQPINNGVYRAGFATSQEAYEEAVTQLFDVIDYWEEVLEK